MDINELFDSNLFERELYSFEDYGGDFILQNLDIVTKPSSIDTSILQTLNLEFLNNLRQTLTSIYSQVHQISIGWEISEEVKNSTLDKIEWLNNYRIKNEFNYNFIREQISGTINIVSLEEMFDYKKYSYLQKDGVRYLPFDLHYSLMICFKLEDGKIEDNLFIINAEDSEKVHDMHIGCIKYLELAYQAKLFYNWQYAFSFKNSSHNERLNEILPKIFPFVELDLSNFK